MGVSTFKELLNHEGHKIVCVGYGQDRTENMAVECETCGCILFDYDRNQED